MFFKLIRLFSKAQCLYIPIFWAKRMLYFLKSLQKTTFKKLDMPLKTQALRLYSIIPTLFYKCGNVTSNTLPLPTSLCTSILPW